MPQQMLQPPALRQALVDESERLTTGRITAEEFSRSLEAAAAEDRARLADPGRVEYRHPAAGAALIAIVAAMAAALGWRGFRGGGRGAAGAAREAYLGPLRTGAALGFVGPAGALYAALVIGPALAACGWAFMQWDGVGPRAFAGLFNFKSLLFDSDVFWMALKNNLYLMVVPALVVVPLALLFAALFHRGVWGARVFRVVFLFPNMLGGLAATLIWLGAYEPHGGLVNAGLSAAGRALRIGPLAGIDGYPWLAPAHLYTALIPIYVWMACGFNLVLYLAAMEGIDPQLYEAAALDGASPGRQFFTITLPLIREVIAISAVFLVINGLNAFEMVWLLTSQQPQSSTHTLGTLLVTKLFQDMSVGQATALAVILFALVFAAGAAVFRLLRRDAIEA
jgi:raffinose/stachyose/melibiose transport system permease protein